MKILTSSHRHRRVFKQHSREYVYCDFGPIILKTYSKRQTSLWAPQTQEDDDEIVDQSSTQARAQTPFQEWQEEEEEEEEEEKRDPFPVPSWVDRLAQEGGELNRSMTPFQSVRLLPSQINNSFLKSFRYCELANPALIAVFGHLRRTEK